MTRKVVVTEGKEYPQGVIQKGALEVHTDIIPILSSPYSKQQELAGNAAGFERDDETGDISFDLDFFQKYTDEELKMYEITIEAFPIEITDDSVFTYGRIRAILVIPLPGYPVGANPGALIERKFSYLAVYQSMDRVWTSWLKDEAEAVEWAKKFPLDVVMAVAA